MEDLWTRLERMRAAGSPTSVPGGAAGESSSVENHFLVFLGDGQSGKSSLIQTFLKPQAAKETKPTIALEYNFARRTAGSAKSIANIYEIGGDFLEPKLLEVVVDKTNLHATTVCLCLDLAKPHNVIVTLLRHLTLLKEVVSRRVSELQASNVNALNALRADISTVYATHTDASRIRPLEVGLVVIANKYASLRNLQSGEKRLLLQSLRFICHYFGAALLCCELNDSAAKDAYRAALGGLAFGQSLKQMHEINDKFALITRGMDSYEGILLGANLQPDTDTSSKTRYRLATTQAEADQLLTAKGVSRDCWKRISELSIGAFGDPDPAPSLALNSGESKVDTGEEEGKENDNPFPEPEIDDVRAARDAALARYVQEMERKRDMLAKMNARSAKDT